MAQHAGGRSVSVDRVVFLTIMVIGALSMLSDWGLR